MDQNNKQLLAAPTEVGHAEVMTISASEAAKILGVSCTTVLRLIARGKLRALGSIRHKRIPRSEIVKFLAK